MKKILKFCVVILCLCLMTGCGSKKDGDNVNEEKNNGSKLTVSDNLYMTMDGVKYELNNLTYDKFESNGWYFSDSSIGSKVLQGQKTNKYTMPTEAKLVNDKYNRGISLYVTFYNDEDDDKKLEDTKIFAISYVGALNDELLENQPNIKLPGNLTLGSSKDSVIKVFGEPEFPDSNVYIYGNDYMTGYYKFQFSEKSVLYGFEFYKEINF